MAFAISAECAIVLLRAYSPLFVEGIVPGASPRALELQAVSPENDKKMRTNRIRQHR